MSSRSTTMRMDGTQSTPYPMLTSQPMAFTIDEPPPSSYGPRLKSHSMGPMPDSPKLWLVRVRVCSVPQRHVSESSPMSSDASFHAVASASAMTASRPVAPEAVLLHHGESGWPSRVPTTLYQRSPP